MTRQLLLTVLVFVVAMGSGMVIGVNLPRHGESAHPRGRSWLADELKLTPQQREKMKTIWEQMLPGGSDRESWQRRQSETRRRLYKERDEAIAALVPAEKKGEYEKVLARLDQQMTDMRREQEKAYQKTVEETKAILNPEQRAKYEELLKKAPLGLHRPGTNPSATQPVAK